MRPDPMLLGIIGHKGAGKDTAGEHLHRVHAFERYGFADPIKSMLTALMVECDVDYHHLFEAKLKEAPIPELGGITARHLMQTLGTEWAREHVHPDFWLLVASRVLGFPSAPVHDRIVITDVRFPNEAAWIRAQGGKLIRIVRPEALSRDLHASETLSPHLEVDNELLNDLTPADLGRDLTELLGLWGWQ